MSRPRHPFCVDCRWAQPRFGLDSGGRYYCLLKRLPLGDSILWMKACRKYSPQRHQD